MNTTQLHIFAGRSASIRRRTDIKGDVTVNRNGLISVNNTFTR